MATRKPRRRNKRARKRTSLEAPRHDAVDKCYVCGRPIAADAKIRRFHELMVHETCYMRDLNP